MPDAKLYRVLQPGEPRPRNVVRIRIPTAGWTDHERPKAGYRCRNEACSVAAVYVEADSTTLPLPRTPHLMTDAHCPFCGRLLTLVSYYDVVELVPVEEQPGR